MIKETPQSKSAKALQSPLKPGREPQALSAEYHKARKQLMLWSAILFIWELVGIDLEKAKEAGGNAGAIIGSIKSPQAVPWALLIVVLYFAFKLRIEWGQCHLPRRHVRESLLDYYSAFIVAAAALLLYLGQTLSHIQFANAVQESSSRFYSASTGASGLALLTLSIYLFWSWYVSVEPIRTRTIMLKLLQLIVGFCIPFCLLIWRLGVPRLSYVLFGALITSVTFGLPLFIFGRRVIAQKKELRDIQRNLDLARQ